MPDFVIINTSEISKTLGSETTAAANQKQNDKMIRMVTERKGEIHSKSCND